MKTTLKHPGKRPQDQKVRTPGIQPGETVVTVLGHRAPRLPHERDESGSSQDSAERGVIKQAHEDLKAGIKDDDVSAPMDETYAREFRGNPKSRKTKSA